MDWKICDCSDRVRYITLSHLRYYKVAFLELVTLEYEIESLSPPYCKDRTGFGKCVGDRPSKFENVQAVNSFISSTHIELWSGLPHG